MSKKSFIKLVKDKDKKIDSKTIKKIFVNLITAIRALGSIAIIPIFLNLGAIPAALTALGFFATDFIDGQLARRFHVQTFFGSLLDAVADKAFGIVCIGLISTINPIYLIIAYLEASIFRINYNNAQNGCNVKSSLNGKIKTWFLALSIIVAFLSKDINLFSLPLGLTSMIIALPTIIYQLIVENEYLKAGDEHEQKQYEEQVLAQSRVEDIKNKKAELVKKREMITNEMQKKNKQEIIHDLFDTEFYLENQDKEIKKLLYKPKRGIENGK